jgi:hypothetical protein
MSTTITSPSRPLFDEAGLAVAGIWRVVVVLFENRSLDNVLGHLFGPEDGRTFEGVIGKDPSNPIPEWAEHGAERKVVPYTVGNRSRRVPDRISGSDLIRGGCTQMAVGWSWRTKEIEEMASATLLYDVPDEDEKNLGFHR